MHSPRRVEPRARGKRDRTREQLLDAGMRVFARCPMGEVSIREIAAEAGMANGTFYNYFRTKEQLGAALSERLVATFHEGLAGAGIDDPAERVAIAVRGFISHALDEPVSGWAVLRISESSAANPRLIESFLSDLRAGRRSGAFVGCTEAAAIDLAFGSTLSAMRAVLEGRAGPGHDVATAELVLRAFGVPPAAASEIARRPLPGHLAPARFGAHQD